MRVKPIFLTLTFIAAGLAVYGSGLAIPHYGDDLVVTLDSPSSKVGPKQYGGLVVDIKRE